MEQELHRAERWKNQRCHCTRSQEKHFVELYIGTEGGFPTVPALHGSKRWLRGLAITKGRTRADRAPVIQGVNFLASQSLLLFICKGGLELNQMHLLRVCVCV